MKIILLFSIIFLIHASLAVIFPGPCPTINSVPITFQCSSKIKTGSFRVVAYLPVDGKTLNMFYNPYATIDCIDFLLTCSWASSIDLQMRPNCYPTMKGNDTSGIVEQCLPITFDPRIRGDNQVSSFGLGLQLICRDKLALYLTSLIFDTNEDLLGIHGCRNLDDDTHDEGSWVLATTTKDLPSNPMEYLENFLTAATNVSASTTDFQINDFSVEHSCDCQKCSYTLECPVDEDADQPVYDYYQGVNYNDYPQIEDVYSDNYKTENTDTYYNYDNSAYNDYDNDIDNQPVYYYYDTPANDSDKHYEDYYNYDYHNSGHEHSTTEATLEPIQISSTMEPFKDGKWTEGTTWETHSEILGTTESSFQQEFVVTVDQNEVHAVTENNQEVTMPNNEVKDENSTETTEFEVWH